MQIYLVGGAVRDTLLDYPHSERDWVVVGATPEQLLALGYQPVGKDFPVFLHPDSKEEYALARTERKTAPGYTGFACFASPEVTLEQDLLRRDLTINAMAQDAAGNIIDPYGGQRDLAERKLRHVSPAFTEDPLRVLRVARFCARYAELGFSVASETLELMQTISHSGELQALPAERVWKELARALTEPAPEQFLAVLEQADALAIMMPELCQLSAHSIAALKRAAKNHAPLPICFALLFANIDPQHAEKFCRRLKAPKQHQQLALLVSRHAIQYNTPPQSAEQLLELLEQLDAFRRPDRFEQFLSCGELLFNQPDRRHLLHKALQRAEAIDAAAIAATGIGGKAIALELRNQRLHAINQLLNKTP